jgi:NADH-quinone oxidoreductase subunit L
MNSPGYFLLHLWLVPFFPLVSALLMFLFGRRLPKEGVNAVCVGSVLLSFVYALGAVLALFNLPDGLHVYQQIYFHWLPSGVMPASAGPANFDADWGYLLDPLSGVMIILVMFIGLLVYAYSIGYMANDGSYSRFFGYLNLFMFSMLTLVLANNLLLLFAGWEITGLSSYLLIGFYFTKKTATEAAKKAFVIEHIGSAGLLVGTLMIAGTFGTVRFTSQGLGDSAAFNGILQALGDLAPQHQASYGAPIFTAIAVLLFAGAGAKSAQFPLLVWLPDAMEAPTPASALIHGGTMVSAGVYLVVRMSGIYQLAPVAMDVVAITGAVTALLAATLAVVQTNIKKVLAYSTISQLGCMFLALGVGAFAAGVFHLMTCTFFSALLFLGAGNVIYSLSGEQDIRKMGGLRYTIPATSVPFMIATWAVAGVPGLSGFFSKNEILSHTFDRHQMLDRYLLLWAVGLLTAGMTALYMFRLLFETFYGRSRIPAEMEGRIHETPKTMTAPLMILTLFCIVSGWLALPILWGEENPFGLFLEPSLRGAETGNGPISFGQHPLVVGYAVMSAFVAFAVFGFWLADKLYLANPKLHGQLAAAWPRMHNLLVKKYYLDEIYEGVFVNRFKDLSRAVEIVDTRIIDGVAAEGAGWLARVFSSLAMWLEEWVIDPAVNLFAWIPKFLSMPVRMFQSGVFSTYVMFILIGLAILIGYYGHHVQAFVRTLH